MKIALLQLNPTIGDFSKNFSLIESYYKEANRQDADIVVTPECALTGYPSQDLWLEESFQREQNRRLSRLEEMTAKGRADLIVGCIQANLALPQRRPSNSALWFSQGKTVFRQDKSLLPNYDVFDDNRYFSPAPNHALFHHRGKSWLVGICEDFWNSPQDHTQSYDFDPTLSHEQEHIDCVISLNASPFSVNKFAQRNRICQRVTRNTHAPMIYVNQASMVDNILFDGQSFFMNQQGQISQQLPAFEECLTVVDLDQTHHTSKSQLPQENPTLSIIQAITFGIREYTTRGRFRGIVMGLSGGIDSAVVAALAVKALGPKNVHAFALPGPFNLPISLEDARTLSGNLGMELHTLPIDSVLQTASQLLGKDIKNLQDLQAYENLQSRIRGMLLMTYANAHDLIVLNTGNKSEIATGYCTLYGDTNGAMSPLGDVLKTEVYDMARELNRHSQLIPQRIIDRAPSAELRPNQKDQDSLPPYDLLDRLIHLYIVERLSSSEISRRMSLEQTFVELWLRKIEGAEFKRRQMPFVLRVSERAFDTGRRVPIMKRFP